MFQNTTRWQQRYKNYQNALKTLVKYSQKENLSELERAGLIQMFEVAFELAWKTQKDYLNYQAFNINSPREAIKKSFQIELIEDGETWLNALLARNATTHIYDETLAKEMVQIIIRQYIPAMQQLSAALEDKQNNISSI